MSGQAIARGRLNKWSAVIALLCVAACGESPNQASTSGKELPGYSEERLLQRQQMYPESRRHAEERLLPFLDRAGIPYRHHEIPPPAPSSERWWVLEYDGKYASRVEALKLEVFGPDPGPCTISVPSEPQEVAEQRDFLNCVGVDFTEVEYKDRRYFRLSKDDLRRLVELDPTWMPVYQECISRAK